VNILYLKRSLYILAIITRSKDRLLSRCAANAKINKVYR
jgi:hypothetical protein